MRRYISLVFRSRRSNKPLLSWLNFSYLSKKLVDRLVHLRNCSDSSPRISERELELKDVLESLDNAACIVDFYEMILHFRQGELFMDQVDDNSIPHTHEVYALLCNIQTREIC